jgi:hypothetical protein
VYAVHESGIGSVAPVAAPSTTAPSGRRDAALRALRERTTTTPGKLMLVAVLTFAGAILFGAIATSAERSRARAAIAVRSQTEPLLGQAVTLYTRLSQANATVTSTFVTGGLEPPAARSQYLADLEAASRALATLAREVTSSSRASVAVRKIIVELPVYSGLIESARFNNREGHPVGAAYLRQASALLTGTILPAADALYSTEAKRLTDNYASGTGTGALVVLVATMAIALAVLVLAQRFLTHISQRILNVGMVVGTIVLVGVAIWATVGLLNEQSSLSSARRASDSVEVLSATSVLLSRAQSDQSLTLVNRGSDEVDPPDFTQVMARLDGTGGLIADAAARARQAGDDTGATELTGDFARYRALNASINADEEHGRTADAIATATDPAATAVTSNLAANLAGEMTAAQRRFNGSAASATGSLSGLSIAIPVLTAVAAILVLLGLRQRLREYRYR